MRCSMILVSRLLVTKMVTKIPIWWQGWYDWYGVPDGAEDPGNGVQLTEFAGAQTAASTGMTSEPLYVGWYGNDQKYASEGAIPPGDKNVRVFYVSIFLGLDPPAQPTVPVAPPVVQTPTGPSQL